MVMRLRADLCLVKLAPVMSLSTIIHTSPEAEMFDEGDTAVVLVRQSDQPVHGKVVQVGEKVRDVAVGDVVMFSPEVGIPCDGMFATPHLMIPVTQIDAVVPPRGASV